MKRSATISNRSIVPSCSTSPACRGPVADPGTLHQSRDAALTVRSDMPSLTVVRPPERGARASPVAATDFFRNGVSVGRECATDGQRVRRSGRSCHTPVGHAPRSCQGERRGSALARETLYPACPGGQKKSDPFRDDFSRPAGQSAGLSTSEMGRYITRQQVKPSGKRGMGYVVTGCCCQLFRPICIRRAKQCPRRKHARESVPDCFRTRSGSPCVPGCGDAERRM